MKMNRRNKRHSFTLIEVVVVIVILVTLAGVATPMYMKYLESSRKGAAQTQIGLFKDALSSYALDVDTYPSDLTGLVTNVDENPRWEGPYISTSKIPTDPWGGEYQYVFPGEHGEYDLYTFGADMQEGGEGKNADITSWD